MKNFIQNKKDKNTNPNSNPEQTEENQSKKKKIAQAKIDRNDDEAWEEIYPQYQVNVKNISEIKQKKQEPSKGIDYFFTNLIFFNNFQIHGINRNLND